MNEKHDVYIDVSDVCWRWNVLMTTFRCHQHLLFFYISVGYQHSVKMVNTKMSPTSKFCHQQPKNFTSFKSPTSLSRIFWYDERFIEDVRIIIDLFRQTLSIVIAVHTQILKMISNWMRLICQILGTGWGCKMKGFRKNLRQLALKKYMQQTVFKTLLKLYWSEKLITSDNW